MPGPIVCPRDGSTTDPEVHRGRFGHFAVQICPKCGGSWFDHGEIGKLYRDHAIEKMIVDYAGGPSRMTCPRCGKPTAPRPVSGFTLDVCPSCRGVWFDRDELQAAAQALSTEEARDGLRKEFGLSFGRNLHARDFLPLVFYAPGFHAALMADLDKTEEKSASRLDDL